ncbi:hypothetical protein GQ600_9104 [Phytophthora cactorum]|nr:hypothetical protein GQ600_25550 [Phytophthora cactorum]KAF1792553.1 hypothetical protein GQ600_9104 [Phytophthora cactorum]
MAAIEEGTVPVHVLVVVPVELPTAHDPHEMRLDVGALVAFWNALRRIPTQIIADAVIALPEGTFILGDSTQGSRIYIRRCCSQLWKVCWKMIHDKVTNTPHLESAKRFIGYVILLHLARVGATVVYGSGGSKKRFLFSRDMVVQGSQQDFVGILDQPTTYYIVDAVKPTYYPAKTILLTSPRSSVWFEFNKIETR